VSVHRFGSFIFERVCRISITIFTVNAHRKLSRVFRCMRCGATTTPSLHSDRMRPAISQKQFIVSYVQLTHTFSSLSSVNFQYCCYVN
jgi:hypothetical protein